MAVAVFLLNTLVESTRSSIYREWEWSSIWCGGLPFELLATLLELAQDLWSFLELGERAELAVVSIPRAWTTA
jgi:hypothetical protein